MPGEDEPIRITELEIVGQVPADVRREFEMTFPAAARAAEDMLNVVDSAAQKLWELARDPRILFVQAHVRPSEHVDAIKLETDGSGQVLMVEHRRFRPRRARVVRTSDGKSTLIVDTE